MRIFLKPSRPDLIVRNFQRKDFRPLNPDGEWVEEDPQWLRYLECGDVVPAEENKSEIKKDKPKRKGDFE